jgi:hypothetical protein
MKFPNVGKVIAIIYVFCFGMSLFSQTNNRKEEVLSIINQRGKTIELPGKGMEIDGHFYADKLKPSDVPPIYDCLFDKTIPFDIRRKLAITSAYLDPDRNQIDRIFKYIIDNLPQSKVEQGDILGPLLQGIKMLYYNTKNDGLLQPFRTLYEDSNCMYLCKASIFSVLNEAGSPLNIPLYDKILAKPDSAEWERHEAILGIGESGGMKSLPYLRDMANYLFDPDEKRGPGHTSAYKSAVSLLGKMSAEHYEASAEIQDIITKVCNTNEYGYLMKASSGSVEDLFYNLKKRSDERNRKYLEDLLRKGCNYQYAKQLAINTLGYIGNNESIDVLSAYKGIYPEDANKAIGAIKARRF